MGSLLRTDWGFHARGSASWGKHVAGVREQDLEPFGTAAAEIRFGTCRKLAHCETTIIKYTGSVAVSDGQELQGIESMSWRLGKHIFNVRMNDRGDAPWRERAAAPSGLQCPARFYTEPPDIDLANRPTHPRLE